MIHIDFMFILTYLTVFSGIIVLIDRLYWKPIRQREHISQRPRVIEYCHSFFPVLLLVLILRSFIFQPYYVPSGSLEPTIRPGDYVFVTQYNYGLHIPVINKDIIHLSRPKRGDIVLLRWPVNPNVTFIKRVIGLPGDKISYIGKTLYVNGQAAKQSYLKSATDSDTANGPHWPVDVYQENLLGVKHNIYVCATGIPNCPTQHSVNFYNLTVPKDAYFVMGDNRDNSDDSRDWGFVPAGALTGKAQFIFFSYNHDTHEILWHRIGTKL